MATSGSQYRPKPVQAKAIPYDVAHCLGTERIAPPLRLFPAATQPDEFRAE
jgi:hypothetical protein